MPAVRADWPKDMAGLGRYAEERGWTVSEIGNRLHWTPPGATRPAVRTPTRAVGRGIENYIHELRTAGLPDPRRLAREEATAVSATAPASNHRAPEQAPEPSAAPADREEESLAWPASFVEGIAELMDEEVRRRMKLLSTEANARLEHQIAELLRQNAELRAEVGELQRQLADRQALEDRVRADAIAEAQAAIERVLGKRTP